MPTIYPPELLQHIRSAWNDLQEEEIQQELIHELPPLPSDDALVDLLNVAYQTSLLREEGRKLVFRILYLPRSDKEQHNMISWESRLAEFITDRPLDIAELRRLAPAADSNRSMICVDHNGSAWCVRGILDTGANWRQFTRHESNSGTPPPNYIAISSAGPGELTISVGGEALLSLKSGKIYFPRGSVLDDGPVKEYFSLPRRNLYNDTISRLDSENWDADEGDDHYPMYFYDMCLLRILYGIVELGHGGTLIVIPDHISFNDSRLTDRITIKHACKYDYVWDLMVQNLELHRKYFNLYFPLFDSNNPINPIDFNEMMSLGSRRESNNDKLAECLRFIASLSSVDGALVITTRLRVIGFGGEVIAQSPTLQQIQLAIDPLTSETRPIPIEAYGTRHRSAFRFVSSYEDSIAFIVSSDGGVKAAKRVGSDIVLWPQVHSYYWAA